MTVIEFEPVQPKALPVTVYIVVVTGDTEIGVPAKGPGLHVYIVPATELTTSNEEVDPTQIIAGVAEGVKTGFGFTVTTTLLEPVQPAAVAVTVYVVVEFGLTVTGEPGKLPGIHENIDPGKVLVALKEVEAPLQMAVGLAAAVTAGTGFTVTITVLVPVHPAAVPVTV